MNPLHRAAVIAIGSNSTRMLCADLVEGLRNPLRGRQETRLFLSMTGQEGFNPEAVRFASHAVSSLHKQALAGGAERVYLTATSAARDAGNVGELTAGILLDTGLDLLLLTGEEEARYSFLGAVHPFDTVKQLGVIDIGGGSTELAVGNKEALRLTLSLQLGAARLFRTNPINNYGDIAPAMAACKQMLDGVMDGPDPLPADWLLVGGTGAALIGLKQGRVLPPDAPDAPITYEDALRNLQYLAVLTPEERAAFPGMTPGRENILPTGLAILISLMEQTGIWEMTVTARNNTDGFLYSLLQQSKEKG